MKRAMLGVLAATAAVLATSPAMAGDVFKGRKLYMQHCANCHGNDGVPSVPGTPHLSRGEGLMAPEQTLVNSLRFGRGLMPGFEAVLRGREFLDVLAYARTLRR